MTPTHQEAIASGRGIVDIVLHEVFVIIEQHSTIRFCRHCYSIIGHLRITSAARHAHYHSVFCSLSFAHSINALA